jgi:hypothetical protein
MVSRDLGESIIRAKSVEQQRDPAHGLVSCQWTGGMLIRAISRPAQLRSARRLSTQTMGPKTLELAKVG